MFKSMPAPQTPTTTVEKSPKNSEFAPTSSLTKYGNPRQVFDWKSSTFSAFAVPSVNVPASSCHTLPVIAHRCPSASAFFARMFPGKPSSSL